MAKKSMIAREKKRSLLGKKYADKRKALKLIIASQASSESDRLEAVRKLQELPRDSSLSRQRKRCALCGRSRGNYRRTGLCRIHMRKQVTGGFVPGMRKASW